MNKMSRMIFGVWMVVTTSLIGIYAHAENLSLPDSLITDDYVYEYTFSDFDKAVQIMRELRNRKTCSQFRLDVTEGDLYFNTGRYLQALKFYKRVLESDSVQNNDKEYMEQVHRMISCYDCLHDEAKKANYVQLLLQKAEQCSNMEMKSIALFNMGKMVYYQEDKPRGYEMIKEAIELMKQTDYKYKYDNLRYNYNSLLIMQQRDKRYEDALQTLEELEKVVTEATSAEPDIEGLADKERKTMYAQRAVVLSRLGRIEEADEAYQAWEAIGKAYTKDDYLIVPYLMDRKRYDKVIGMYTSREAFLYANKDTINYHMMAVKRSLAKAYEGKGDHKQASRYYEALAILTDSLKAREQKSSAIELATVYETHEREAELQEQTEQVKMRNVLLFSSGVILMVLLVLFVLNVRHTRTIHRKNAAMVKTIHDLLGYKDELFHRKEENRMLKEQLQAAEGERQKQEEEVLFVGEEISVDTGNSVEETSSETIVNGQALFDKVEHEIISRRLYLQPDFSRTELMKLVRIPKNKFALLFKQYAGASFLQYINNLRLEYAARMLKEHPEYVVEAIAIECGIPNKQTFYRLFLERFGMTPTEYRVSKE